ncbi:MAG: hypothetical protein KatS3mg129_1163 [Leptospiraceae bacterium]|nr:MAG: hypothetical protein KatS3mg129_1163 [Leptospiraceae bacterium]
MKIKQFNIIFIILVFFACVKKQENQQIQEQIGKILFFEGNVTINNQLIQNNDHKIQYGDIIKTAEKSKIRFIIKDGLIIQLNQNSEFTLNYENKKFNLKLKKGWIAAVKNQDENQMDIEIPTAVASVRGTSICFKIESENSNYACTCNGKLHWHTKDGQMIEVAGEHHSARRFKEIDGKIQIEEAGIEYHNDNIIKDLAKEINHTLNWE